MVEKCALVYGENWKRPLLVTKWHNDLWLSSLYIPDPAACTQPRSAPLTLVILLRCIVTMCFLFLLHHPLTYWMQSVKRFSHVKWFAFWQSALNYHIKHANFDYINWYMPNTIKLILNIYTQVYHMLLYNYIIMLCYIMLYTQVYWTIGIGTCLYPSDYS